MQFRLTLILCIFLPFISSGQFLSYETITHDGLVRDYSIYIPPAYSPDEPAPLVFNFHGYGSNMIEQLFYGDLRPVADTAGFIIIHPQGTLDASGIRHFNVGWGGSSVDDISFTSALIDSVSAEYNVDPNRIYSTGMSNGGFISYYLACQLSDRIAAIASVTGSMSPLVYSTCNPQHPVPILEIHGTNDATVPFNGGTFAEPIDDVMEYWSTYNNCNSEAAVLDLPDINTTDGSTVQQIIYSGCDCNIETVLFKIFNGAHEWPGNGLGFPGTNFDINASREVWKFFLKYSLDEVMCTTGIGDDIQGSTIIKVYPNPASTSIQIERAILKPTNYQLISALGEIVVSGQLNSTQSQIDVSGLSPQLYFLKIGSDVTKFMITR